MQAALTKAEISQRALKAFNNCVDTYVKFDNVSRSAAIDKAIQSPVGQSLWGMAHKLGSNGSVPVQPQAPARAPYQTGPHGATSNLPR